MKATPLTSNATRILVVDDQPDLAELVSTFLTDEGYDVRVCVDSREAVEMIKSFAPAALILDIMMPDTDGFEVLRQLRGNAWGKRLPVILMSAAWRPGEKKREIGTTLEVAPTMVLPKPFELNDIERCLRQMGVKPVAVT